MLVDPQSPAVPASSAQLAAHESAATPEELQRAFRILLGGEQALWERDLVSGENWYSPQFLRLLGLPPLPDREAINARIHPEDRAHFESVYARGLREGGRFGYDVRYRNERGDYRWARATVRVWLSAQGRAERLIGALHDVHAEKQAQLDAHAHAMRYGRALDASAEAYVERTVGIDDFFISDNLPLLLGHPAGTPRPDAATFIAWVHDEDRLALHAEIRRGSRHLGLWHATFRLRTYDGRWRWFRGRGRSELDEQGRIRMSGMIGDVHQQVVDQSELHEHRHRLSELVAERTARLDAALVEAERQREEAERARRAQSQFLAHMSHELRTPLHGLIGLSQLSRSVAILPAQQRYLDVALESGRMLLQLIESVLDYSSIDSGGIALADQPFDLPESLAQCLRAQAPDIDATPLALCYDWFGGGSTRIRGDEARVRQVVNNLLANAIKFTPSGHVALRAGWVGAEGVAPWISVQVEDTGPGIAPERQQAVFDAFVQGDASLTRAHGGVGLGLAIARRLARAMGGDVALLRSGADGSCFEFRWPATALAESPGDALLDTVLPGIAWLVNRQPVSSARMRERLHRLQWRTEVFDGPADVLARARASLEGSHPDLLMVGQNALGDGSPLPALRSALPRARVAVVVRPVWRQPDVEALARSLSMEPVVMPLTPRDLVRLLQPAAPARPRVEPIAAAQEPGQRHVLLVEDNPVNSMIAEAYLRQLGVRPQCATHGAEALEACREQVPDLVLMDLQMPVMDGLEATQRLRRLQAEGLLPSFPIIALSAHAGESDRQQAAAAGVDGYLTKPILLDDLRGALARFWPDLRT